MMSVLAARRRGRDVDARRDFGLLWVGQTVSLAGSQATLVAAPVVAVTVLHASPGQVGLLSAAETAAYLVIALPAGVLVDRIGPRVVMAGANLMRLLLTACLAVLLAGHLLSFSLFLTATALAGGFGVLFDVAYPTLVPSLVPSDSLLSANARLSATQAGTQVVGPGAGGFVVGLAGATIAYVVDAASFLVSLATLGLIRKPRAAGLAMAEAGKVGFGTALTAGLRYSLRDGILRAGMLWSGTANVFVIVVESIGVLYLLRSLGLSPAAVGVVLALGALGGVAGGVAAGTMSRAIGSSRVTWMAMTLFALPGLLIPLSGQGVREGLFAVGWIAWTFSATLASINLSAYRQQTCPPELLGRVNACVRWVTWGTLPLGGLLGAGLASWIGVRATLWVGVVGGCASGLWLLFSPLRLQRDLPTAHQPA